MVDFTDLTQAELRDFLRSYDQYIQDANDEDRFRSGWRPVCIHEYLNNEFAEEQGWW
jgi:hypothetical protein